MRVVFRTKDSALWTLNKVPSYRVMTTLWKWILDELASAGYEEVFWTSHYRRKGPGDSGVHDTNPCRARDFFVVGMSKGSALKFAEHVNENWLHGRTSKKTGKPFKVLVWHDTGRGLHFHAQVRGETRRV